jgi:hypothetical protein
MRGRLWDGEALRISATAYAQTLVTNVAGQKFNFKKTARNFLIKILLGNKYVTRKTVDNDRHKLRTE